MTTGSSQLVRQWLLLKKLCASHSGKTVAELSSELEVNAKTIRRDLTVFHDAGFPIEESTGPSGRKSYHIANGSQRPDLSFTYDEALALYLGRQYLEPLAGTFLWEAAQNAFRKIEATLGPKALKYLDRVAEAFHQTNFGVSDYATHAETIDSLLVGIEDRKVVFITYRSQRSTEPVTYDVHPYSLTRHRDTLYLLGFKPEDNAFRTWKVNRIESAQVDSMPFTRRPDFNAEQFLAGSLGIYHDTGVVNVTIRFSSEVARYVEESNWHSSQQCERQADGSLLVRLDLSGTTEVNSWVLSFGRHAEVLVPDALRSELQDEMAAALKLYSNDGPVTQRKRVKARFRKAR
ncbi:MAG: WYL domain-containing transcriptional regulator [Planctomycetaceae bacterium]|nr:WYL domain-containing transcriptional regulator [Planctomycetaceae bacterium]